MVASIDNFVISEQRGTLDESDRFMLDPHGFASEFAKNWSLPSHIVLFDSEERKLKDFLTSYSYREVWLLFLALITFCVQWLSCLGLSGEKILPCSLQSRPWASIIDRFVHVHRLVKELQSYSQSWCYSSPFFWWLVEVVSYTGWRTKILAFSPTVLYIDSFNSNICRELLLIVIHNLIF